jgi:hypothetical protein
MAQIPINIPADTMQLLQQAIAAVQQDGWGTKFTVQPLAQPGEGCRERFVGTAMPTACRFPKQRSQLPKADHLGGDRG